MQKTRLILGILIVLTISFIGFKVFKQDVMADIIRALLLPLLTVLYCLKGKEKSGYFFSFLVIYSISELLGLVSYYDADSQLFYDFLYFGGNILYITAYLFLILEVLKWINIREMFNRFPLHVIILLALDIYSIIFVTEIAIKSELLVGFSDYLVEILYNTVIMLLLTVTLINYINRDSKKAMNLLLGALCIVFSEVIQVAYFYVAEISILNVAYSVLLVIAFGFFYIQVGMSHEVKEVYSPIEKLEA